jgi:hypothetical protein
MGKGNRRWRIWCTGRRMLESRKKVRVIMPLDLHLWMVRAGRRAVRH